MTPVIDAVSNLFTQEVVSTRPAWSRGHMAARFSVDDDTLTGRSVDQQLDAMDLAGIDRAILVVQRMGPPGSPGHWAMDHRPVVDAIAAHPGRFSGQLGIDPTAGRRGIDLLRSLVSDHGFVGAHFYPHWFDMSPDSAHAFPAYEVCAELGIPVQIQVGQALVYSPERPLRSVGRPLALEPIAQAFPELAVVGSHLGHPWTEELIAVATVHPNVYICTDSYAPVHWPEALDRFVGGAGVGKVMFGTMWPTIPFQRAVSEIQAKDLGEAANAALLGGTAAATYRLPAD